MIGGQIDPPSIPNARMIHEYFTNGFTNDFHGGGCWRRDCFPSRGASAVEVLWSSAGEPSRRPVSTTPSYAGGT